MTPLRLALALVRAAASGRAAMAAPRLAARMGRRTSAPTAADAGDPGESSFARSTGAVADAVYLRSQAMQLGSDRGVTSRFAVAQCLPPARVHAARRARRSRWASGVNSAVFALLDAVLLRPLPYRDPSRIVFVWQTLPRLNVFEVEATRRSTTTAWHGLRGALRARDGRSRTRTRSPATTTRSACGDRASRRR